MAFNEDCQILNLTDSELEISQAILEAPGWARVGITAPNARPREQAATELARSIAMRLEGTPAKDDGRQFSFELADG